jgi:hypothetical protein
MRIFYRMRNEESGAGRRAMAIGRPILQRLITHAVKSTIRSILWLLYAAYFGLSAIGAVQDNFSLHYPAFFSYIALASYATMFVGLCLHALKVGAPTGRTAWRWLTPIALITFFIGIAMDAILPSDFNFRVAPNSFIRAVIFAAIQVAPAYIGNFRFAYTGKQPA